MKKNADNTIKGPTITYPKSTLHELLAKQAESDPNAMALQFGEDRIRYGELQKRIDQAAKNLWSIGVRPNQVVAVSLERCPDLIVCLFGILQCGAAYIPIDTAYPDARLKLMVADSGADFVISRKPKTSFVQGSKNILIDAILKATNDLNVELIDQKVSTDAAAYIIYTSGSTGKPKGVHVAHRNVINLVHSMGKVPGISSKDKIFAVTTISFDAMVMEIFLPLLHGACVVIVDEDTRRDGQLLLKKAAEDEITVMWGTSSIWQILLDSDWQKPLQIKALIGGEPVPLPLAHELLARCGELWNIYGPTETTVCSFLTRITKDDDPITIGKPIANTHAYLLNEQGNPVKHGEVGEIAIGGDGVSLGYLNRPDLTAERFVVDPFQKTIKNKMYLSGDLGKLLPNGEVQCLGRSDQQVKVRGHRIELGEIESVIGKLPDIKRATVVVSNHLGGEPRLVAYVQVLEANQDTNAVRKQLLEILPDYLVPNMYIWVEDFPITENGKIDKKSLPLPEYVRPDSAPLLQKPRTKLEKEIATIWSEQLGIPVIGINDNFFEMGGTSLITQKVATLIRQRLNLAVPVTKIYQYPTIAEISEYIDTESKTESTIDYSNPKKKRTSEAIAIIGMAGRFPGAQSIPELWDVLKEGKETTSFFKPEEVDNTISASLRNDPQYVAARGIVPSAKTFDASFFGLNLKLAEAMDPQQRLFLEIAWEALEQSGHLPKHYKGSIGVYAGTGTNTYYKNNVLPNEKLLEQVGHLQANTVNEKDYISSRTAYHLNLKGPAVSVHSACSTSLLAIAEATEAIRNGQCDVALAGGSSITAPMYSGHLYQEGSMLSADGHCRSFDAKGKGTVFSDGAGVVLLKSLEAAQNDGDIIYGVIKGVGINNDGGNKGSFTAPSAEGQADAIARALQDAQISPATISYIEAHGTATPLGDPIEMEGLQMAFGKQSVKGYCALGSIKSNMGHLTAAAGVAGLIKTILAMNQGQIPPSLGYEIPNPAIDFTNSPFYVNQKLQDWNVDGLRRAGVSSFGVGGTNVHIVLEEYPEEKLPHQSGRPIQLLAWSAKTDKSLKGYGTALGDFLKITPSVALADVGYSLNVTRDSFAHRSFVLADTTSEASQKLLTEGDKIVQSVNLKVAPNEIAFLFPGQGAQYLHMGKELYEHEKVFRQAVDTCAELLKKDIKLDIRQVIFPEDDASSAENQLKDTRFTQPALFVIEYALSHLWMSWGIKPTILCGHSIGEFVAAHLAGVFSLEDALHLIAVRGKLVADLPRGSMLSVRLAADALNEILPNTLSIAAINSDKLCVVSGPDKEIEHFAQKMKAQTIAHKLLSTSHAFHSTMMDPVVEPFEKELQKIQLQAPEIPVISTVTGIILTDAEALDPGYWTNHLRATVRFSNAMDSILQLEDYVLLEVGPGQALTTLAHQKRAKKPLICVSSLPVPKNGEGAYPALLNTLGRLWLQGVKPDWRAFYSGQQRQKVSLPGYVFDRKPCWVEPIASKLATASVHHDTPIQHDTVIEKFTENEKNNTVVVRKSILLEKISEIIENISGIDVATGDFERSFLELGLDSLILTQMALACKREFNVPVSFRQLNEEFGTPELLAANLDSSLPAEAYAPTQSSAPVQSLQNTTIANSNDQNSALAHIAEQLQLLQGQIDKMQGGSGLNGTVQPAKDILSTATSKPDILSEDEKLEHKKPFGAAPRIERQSTELNNDQQHFLNKLITRYNHKTANSKAYAQKHRAQMADPRVVSGFKPLIKELTYPLVVQKSSGNRLWDMDDNEYIDALNGFGSCLFGHQPDFIKEALQKQIELGYEVGPQHPLAGEVCELLCEFTGHERAALCNTGSEAVLGAMRIARTITGRSLIIAFSRSYHGINDEAIVRGSRKMRTFPAAAGILPEAVQNVLILDYGTEESLDIIRKRSHELAAVLVEPVQSRRPDFQPVDFLQEVRDITTKSKTVFIFDEIITGFRVHPGGAQALFGIKADLATYGKVIGGGLPIGAILGKREYMDALDGGFWQYGDDSYPEVGVTYFAGTFVRHPLALAATKASLNHMKEQGKDLQDRLSAMTTRLATQLNTEFAKRSLPIYITHFSSLWRTNFKEEIPYSELLFVLLREKGIHIWDGFPCFLTAAYAQEDMDKLITIFLACTDELAEAGFFPKSSTVIGAKLPSALLNTPPMPGARLGRDESGNPAWFLVDTKKDGEYVKIDL